jgi:hypothetical protein
MGFRTSQIERGDSMENKKIFVLVKNYMGVNDDIDVLINFESAKRAFLKYTGFAFNDQYQNPESAGYLEKFSETKIFEIELPYFLEFRKAVKEKGGI